MGVFEFRWFCVDSFKIACCRMICIFNLRRWQSQISAGQRSWTFVSSIKIILHVENRDCSRGWDPLMLHAWGDLCIRRLVYLSSNVTLTHFLTYKKCTLLWGRCSWFFCRLNCNLLFIAELCTFLYATLLKVFAIMRFHSERSGKCQSYIIML